MQESRTVAYRISHSRLYTPLCVRQWADAGMLKCCRSLS
jgi:hypothetical protein